MKKVICAVAILSLLIFTGCGNGKDLRQQPGSLAKAGDYRKEEVTEPLIISKIQRAECYLCGKNERSLMTYYRRMNSVGILFLNEWKLTDVRAIALDDKGREIPCDGRSSTSINTYGEDGGMVVVSSRQERGISHVKVRPGANHMLDPELAAEKLCQTCLNQMIDGLEVKSIEELAQETELFLVDFSAVRTYPLSGGRTYVMGDYYIETGSADDEIDVLVLYAPEREIRKTVHIK